MSADELPVNYISRGELVKRIRTLEAELTDWKNLTVGRWEPIVREAFKEAGKSEWKARAKKAEAEVERLRNRLGEAGLLTIQELRAELRGGGRESGVSGERHREDVKDVETTRPTAANREEAIPPAKPAEPCEECERQDASMDWPTGLVLCPACKVKNVPVPPKARKDVNK